MPDLVRKSRPAAFVERLLRIPPEPAPPAGTHDSIQVFRGSLGVNAPPSAPLSGQCWIVGTAPTGVWADHAEALACWTESGWRFVPPVEGLLVWVKDQQLWAARQGVAWAVGEICGSKLKVGGQQVVGPQQPAVTAPAGGGVIDAEAREAIAAILSRLSSHGLIAS